MDEKILATDKTNSIVAHEYHDQLSTEADLDKIHDPVITYDHEATMKNYQQVGDVVGDILPVRLKGHAHASTGTWDRIAVFRGVTNLLMDLAERPEFMHKTVKRLHDANWSAVKQSETLGLLDNDPHNLHCTPILTNDLPGRDFDGEHVKLKNV